MLLLAHGNGDYAHRNATQDNHLIPHLVHLGVSVYAFDMWGSGFSSGKRGATDERQAIADHLAARRALRDLALPVFLLGFSLGGLVTASSVVRDQSNVNGMILMSPAIKYNVNAVLRLLARVRGFIAPTLPYPVPAGKNDLLTPDPETRQRLANDPVLYTGRITWATDGTTAPIVDANWKLYPKIGVPILALHGTADQATDPDGGRQLIERVASPDKTLHLVPSGYHVLLDDTERVHTLGVLQNWLEDRLPV